MLEFLKAYRRWVADGARYHTIFRREFGLCANASIWDREKPRHRACEELTTYLRRDFPDTPNFPFGGAVDYYKATDRFTQHLNIQRLAWVDKMIGELS